jgi:hypothetical protein
MSTPPSPWEEPARQVIELLRAGEREAAFARIQQAATENGASGPIAGFREVAGAAYWKGKALREFVALSHETIRRLDAALAQTPDVDARAPLVKALGGTLYNLAAFTWDGWAEPDIFVGPEELAVGRAAARRCLEVRLAPENAIAGFGYTPAMAHWTVGAHELSARNFGEAREQFRREIAEERSAGESDLLGRGYLALVGLVETPGSFDAQAAFAAVIEALASREGDRDAAFYRDQLLTARRVYLGE